MSIHPEILSQPPARLFMVKLGNLPAQRWRARGMRSDFWRLYNNLDDGAFITVAGRRVDLAAGRSFVIPRDVTFDFFNEAPVHHLFLHFDAPGLEASDVAELDRDPAIDAIARRLHDELDEDEPPPGVRNRAAALLHAALAQLIDRGIAKLEASDPALAPALRYIDSRLHEPLRNKTLALQCHLSEDYFIRRFREDLGTTPASYIRRRRVAEAANRLLHTTHSVESIARDLGFGTRACLDRTFRAVTGLTPAAYRRTTPRV